MCWKDAAAVANSVDPDQTVPSEAVCSGSMLFVQTYLSQNLGFWFDFCFTVLQHILGHFEHGQFP